MNILYFAALKESLKLSNEVIEIHDITVKELKLLLKNKHGKAHFPHTILCAVNHEIANDTIKLNNNDEVAFYPPVTGG